MTFAQDCARRGAALLDAEWPGWVDKIDLELLRLESTKRCVLGQLSARTNTVRWQAYGHDSLEDALKLDDDEEWLTGTICSADWDIARNRLGLTLAQATWTGFMSTEWIKAAVDLATQCDDDVELVRTEVEEWEKLLANHGVFNEDAVTDYSELNDAWQYQIHRRAGA